MQDSEYIEVKANQTGAYLRKGVWWVQHLRNYAVYYIKYRNDTRLAM